MVVCKCRKATKLYCFVHKVPVCGECICFPEHQICVWLSGGYDNKHFAGYHAIRHTAIGPICIFNGVQNGEFPHWTVSTFSIVLFSFFWHQTIGLHRMLPINRELVHTYSEWVIDGEYDWPSKCCHCHAVLEEGTDPETTRLGCLHVIHTSCLVSHIKSFPPHTAPAGYSCPACSTSIWPPKSVKDSGSRLHAKLKEAIMQTGLEKNLFGNLPVSLPATESRSPPPAFASDPLVPTSRREYADGFSPSAGKDSEIVEIDGPSSVSPSVSNHESTLLKSSSPPGAGATTRKSAAQVERQNSEFSYYADDEDANRKKYTRRGNFRHKFLRSLLPFWSSSLPTLPVTAPPRKDALNLDDIPEGRTRHHKSSRMDPRKLLLIIAIVACMATMGILYYRLAQRGLGEELPDDEQR